MVNHKEKTESRARVLGPTRSKALGALAALAITHGSCGPMELAPAGGYANGSRGACTPGASSAQFRSQQAPPTSMEPGDRANVSVTFDNCSGAAWRAGEVALVAATSTRGEWGVARVALTSDVADGERVTVPFEIRAPSEPGRYLISWAMSLSGGERLQEPTPEVPVDVRSSGDCSRPGPVARFRRQEPPPEFVGVREPVRGRVTFINCGAEPWTRGERWTLVSALPDGRSHIETTRVGMPSDVPFGAEVTIDVDGTTPEAPGVYPYAWSIAREGERVGESSPEHRMTVNHRFECGTNSGPTAKFLSQNAPDELDPGQAVDVDVSFANCGTVPWDGRFRLRSAPPATDGRWGAGNIALPIVVGPGFRATTRFRIVAPRAPGAHAYRWAVSEGATALDNPTPERSIRVRFGPGPCEVRPVPGGVTSPYGYRIHPISGVRRLHTGIDFAGANNSTPIKSCRAGVVVAAGWRGSFGYTVEVSHGGGMTTLYAHQHHIISGISPGVSVSGGQIIGVVGTTGASTGPHLHFEVRQQGTPIDPTPYIP